MFIKITSVFLALFLSVTTQVNSPKCETIYSKGQLIEDARQLIAVFEESHPDPYTHGGGKIAFHRRFQEVLRAIPDDGMTKRQFYELLLPFVAYIGDSHTALLLEDGEGSTEPGLPLSFKIIEQSLIIDGVQTVKYKYLLGAIVISIENITIDELIERQGRLRGMETVYGKLALITRSLRTQNGLKRLIPEWENPASVSLKVHLPSDTTVTLNISISSGHSEPSIGLSSKISMPSTKDTDVAYKFLDSKGKTALLVIENMMRYREACEAWYASGFAQADELAAAAYFEFHHTKPPAERDALINGIPSATEVFMSLVRDMKERDTKNLIIDLRKNTGGHSIMREILIYFLYGNRGLASIEYGYDIKKYSELYFTTYTSDNLDSINVDRSFPLTTSDYDFSDELRWQAERSLAEKEVPEHELAKSSTFWNIYKTKRYHEPQHRLDKIIVLCSPWTFSSGFNLLSALHGFGAVVMGSPSAQAPNNFGDSLPFTLINTGIQGYVAYKWIVTYPDEPSLSTSLEPDHKLTYEMMKRYGFDANSELLLALDILD
jgi:hypothetical protein